MMNDRLIRALELIDQANGEDPHTEIWQGRVYPKALLYSMRMTVWLERLAPEASESLRLAARAQHLRRWMVARDMYPAGREGYLRWRTFLYRFHAEQTEGLLRQAGYDDEVVEAVKKMVAKRGVKRDPDVQLIEDVACLVFLEHYFPDFAAEQSADKLIGIVRKTWHKMSDTARAKACQLALPESVQGILMRALSDAESRGTSEG